MFTAGEAVDDEGRFDTADLEKLGVAVLFFDLFAFGVGAGVDRFLRRTVVGEFEFDGEAVFVG